jgi:hypothetical protein
MEEGERGGGEALVIQKKFRPQEISEGSAGYPKAEGGGKGFFHGGTDSRVSRAWPLAVGPFRKAQGDLIVLGRLPGEGPGGEFGGFGLKRGGRVRGLEGYVEIGLEGEKQGGEKTAAKIFLKTPGSKPRKPHFYLPVSLGDKKIAGGRAPMGAVHNHRSAVRFGTDRDKSAGPGNSRKEKEGKKDEQDDKAIEAGQIYAGPDAEYRFKMYLFEGFRLRRGGPFVFPVFVPHTRHYREGAVSCQREKFVLILNK